MVSPAPLMVLLLERNQYQQSHRDHIGTKECCYGHCSGGGAGGGREKSGRKTNKKQAKSLLDFLFRPLLSTEAVAICQCL